LHSEHHTYAVACKEVNGSKKLKSHFFDFVHYNDPKHSILCDYNCDVVSTENAGRGHNLEGGKVEIWNRVADHANEVAFIHSKSYHSDEMCLQIGHPQNPPRAELKVFQIGENSLLKGSHRSTLCLDLQFISMPSLSFVPQFTQAIHNHRVQFLTYANTHYFNRHDPLAQASLQIQTQS